MAPRTAKSKKQSPLSIDPHEVAPLRKWLENCLQSGKRLSEDPYILKSEPDGADKSVENLEKVHFESPDVCSSEDDCFDHKRIKVSCEDPKPVGTVGNVDDQRSTDKRDMNNKIKDDDKIPSLYSPPDLNRNITEIFGKLIDIYRALGDERRSFSYYKAIPVIEKLPYKIESVDQVKHLPTIGKSMQDHINEIVTTGKLSKLEHFEKDEKVKDMEMLFAKSWRRGSARVYPRSIYAFGLIAWTGNDVLNRRLRLLAESKGYRLDDTGLYLAAQSSGGKRAQNIVTTV
ncbi:hypothetical protein J5N97_005054 [Dioscorea zingiberensis]|uniref:BRCT domain-containing protein n=1 Tax=Dioscorea zingiberensis TaxID=325984 RepID=A0A9D5D7R9_9LILI|nr:hypothetical protein J5N97_005054 [Dioscorea zingiberensis]